MMVVEHRHNEHRDIFVEECIHCQDELGNDRGCEDCGPDEACPNCRAEYWLDNR